MSDAEALRVNGILESCLYVDDLQEAERFYCSVLGLEFFSRQKNRHVFLRCGDAMLLIFNAAESGQANGELPAHGATGPGHLALAVPEASLAQWKSRLASAGVEIEREVDWSGRGRSFYFRDPAGNSIELATPRIWGLDEYTP